VSYPHVEATNWDHVWHGSEPVANEVHQSWATKIWGSLPSTNRGNKNADIDAFIR